MPGTIRGVNRRKRHDEIVRRHVALPFRLPWDAPWRPRAHDDPESDFFDSLVDREVEEAVEALPEVC